MRKIGLLVLLLSLLLGQVAYAGGLNQQFAVPILVVNTSFLNARSGPGPQYSVVATVTGGSELPVLGTNGGNTWYLVTTPAGSGWVDVSFTLPRGSFNNVPVIDVSPAATVAFSTPLTIGLPGSTPTVVGGILGGAVGTGERTRAVLNVSSVDLLTQPVNGSPIIGLLFRDDSADYAVVGRTVDPRGVEWLQVVVPNLGTGWIEAPKMSTRLSSTFRTVVVVTAGPVDLTFSPGSASMLFPPLQNGQEAFLVNTSGNFYQVELANGWTGWIPSSAVQVRTGSPSDPGTTVGALSVAGVPVPVLDPGVVIVNTSFLNVRTGPGGHFGSIATVPGSTELTPVGVTPDGTWFLVRGSFGQGWVAHEFVVFRGTFSNIPIINNAF